MGERHGYGTMYWLEDNIMSYDGRWVGNRQDIEGCFYNKGGKLLYDGDHRKGVWWGFGVSYEGLGRMVYKGGWKGGERSGKGKVYDRERKVERYGVWRKGELVRDFMKKWRVDRMGGEGGGEGSPMVSDGWESG